MRKIYLHIGTEKTGTTSIQSFLSRNTTKLNSQDFYVPEFLGFSNRKITGLAFNLSSSDDLFISECINPQDLNEKEEKISSWKNEFSAAVKHSQQANWIVSSEFMQARLKSKEELLNLKNFLSQYFEEIHIVLYIRDQVISAASLWSTAVLSGLPWLNFPEPIQVKHVFDHQETIELWFSVFYERLNIRIFQFEDFSGGSLISDFCNTVKIGLDSTFELTKQENEALPFLSIKALAHINQYLPYLINGRVNPLHNNIFNFIEKHFKSLEYPKISLDKNDINIYSEYFRDSNEWVRKNFFPNRVSLFNPIKISDEQNKVHYTADELHDIYGKLIAAIWLK
jgi:hypothetical protein